MSNEAFESTVWFFFFLFLLGGVFLCFSNHKDIVKYFKIKHFNRDVVFALIEITKNNYHDLYVNPNTRLRTAFHKTMSTTIQQYFNRQLLMQQLSAKEIERTKHLLFSTFIKRVRKKKELQPYTLLLQLDISIALDRLSSKSIT